MRTSEIATIAATEYGLGDFSASNRAKWSRAVARWSRVSEPIASPSAYVGVCRRVGRSSPYYILEGEGRVDGRLVVCGYNHVSPSDWVGNKAVQGGLLGRFLAFWEATQGRPNTVGSSYNACPEIVFAAWKDGFRFSPDTIRRAYSFVVGGEGRVVRRLSYRQAFFVQRALDRASLGGGPNAPARHQAYRWSSRALVALGKLCPELQAVAVESVPDGIDHALVARSRNRKISTIRLTDIDWTEVARVQAALRADTSGRLRAAIAGDRRRAGMLGVSAEAHAKHVAFLAPAFPRCELAQARKLARGQSPAQVSGGILSKKEAHEWLDSAAVPRLEPLEWLQRTCLHRRQLPPLRSAAVVRWLIAVDHRGGWLGLTKLRQFHGPAGVVAQGRFLDKIDEVQDEDLVRGTQTSVDEVFRAAARRVGEAHFIGAIEDHRVLAPLPSGWSLYRNSMRHLNTPATLAREGRELEHCVGGYASAVEKLQCVILGINVRGHRSTVELNRRGRVLQHYGPRNSTPHDLCELVLKRFLKRNKLHQGW